MRNEALFINGIYDGVLKEILLIQSALPDYILFLQPYSSQRIVKLQEHPPSTSDPVQLFASTTEDLNRVHYTGEIVGCDNKRQLEDGKRGVLNRLIWTLQPGEGGLYENARGIDCVNLLHVRRLRELAEPFSVSRLVNIKDGQRLSANRTTAGGWIYVEPVSL